MVRNGFWEKGRWKVRCKRKERISQVNGCRRVVSALCEHTELHLRWGGGLHSELWKRGAGGKSKTERPRVSLWGV